eukprot:684121-Pyramimonas_sp.AAC.1
MEGAWFSKCCSRLRAAFVVKARNRFQKRGRFLFKVWLSSQPCAYSLQKFATGLKMEDGWCSNYGSRRSAAHTRPKLQLWKGAVVSNVQLRLSLLCRADSF